MSNVRVAIIVTITDARGQVTGVDRTVRQTGAGNARFFAQYVAEAIKIATADVLSGVEAIHGKAPTT